MLCTNLLNDYYDCLSAFLIAVIEPFPTVTEPTLLTPVIGESLKITCTPPQSYPNPRGSTYFSFNVNVNKLQNIVYTNRVMLDYEGRSRQKCGGLNGEAADSKDDGEVDARVVVRANY